MAKSASEGLYSFAAGDSVEVLTFASGVLYTFQMGDNERRTVRNRFSLVGTDDAPGEQDGRFLGQVEVKDDNGAYALNIKRGGTPEKPNAVEIPGTTNLGTTFTLSAMVKMTNTGLTRIFSSYSAVDSKVAAYEVLFDVDPSGNPDFQGLPRSAASSFQRAAEPEIYYSFGGERRTIADYLSRQPTTGLLLARDDTILYEHYQYARSDRDRFLSQSMAKTITAMLIGIATAGRSHQIDR